MQPPTETADRRSFLRVAGVTGLGLAATLLLTACPAPADVDQDDGGQDDGGQDDGGQDDGGEDEGDQDEGDQDDDQDEN